MDYNKEIDNQLSNVADPCGSAVPSGYYRRVKWELYNKDNSDRQPNNGEEWETEIIPREKHIWTSSPFGEKSTPYTEPQPVQTGVWCSKLGIYFDTQSSLESYVKSIGATLLSGNDWYGADISKSSLFKKGFEKDMYLIENAGGTYTNNAPRINPKTMLSVSSSNALSINFSCLSDSRRAYMKHYDDGHCTFVGIVPNKNVTVTVPGKPVAEKPTISAFDLNVPCTPVTVKFPYTSLFYALITAWNTTVHTAKMDFSMLSSLPKFKEWAQGTLYPTLSLKMEELANGALALTQEAMRAAYLAFKQIISQALSIVGGAWDIIKSFLPTITIMGIKIDFLNLVENGPNDLIQQLSKLNIDDVIQSIYSAIGSAYDRAADFVKMEYRDLVDAVTEFYDWCFQMVFNACTALSKYLLELTIIWTMPPTVPNPLWLIAQEVKKVLSQIEPLNIILSGNFPGFTANDIYEYVKAELKKLMDTVYADIEKFKKQYTSIKKMIIGKKNEINSEKISFSQYMARLGEKITDETTKFKQEAIAKLESEYEDLKQQLTVINSKIEELKNSVADLYAMAIEKIKEFPLMSNINHLLDLAGASLDSLIINVKSNITSMYHQYSDSLRALKDTCKSIYNQVYTLALSKTTQWINMLLQIFGLSIIFPSISFCIPTLKES